jgi:hypothetical protein
MGIAEQASHCKWRVQPSETGILVATEERYQHRHPTLLNPIRLADSDNLQQRETFDRILRWREQDEALGSLPERVGDPHTGPGSEGQRRGRAMGEDGSAGVP